MTYATKSILSSLIILPLAYLLFGIIFFTRVEEIYKIHLYRYFVLISGILIPTLWGMGLSYYFRSSKDEEKYMGRARVILIIVSVYVCGVSIFYLDVVGKLISIIIDKGLW